MNLARPSKVIDPSGVDAWDIAERAHLALLLELQTWPKPGLVSHRDSGAHLDMDAQLFTRSAAAILPFFSELADAGGAGASMARLREIGLAAEAAMMAKTGGVNTHRGAIFGLGLLTAAAGRRATLGMDAKCRLGETVRLCWGRAILQGPRSTLSHGAIARQRFGAGGAQSEAAQGFPAIYSIALPALRHGRMLSQGNEHAARVQACFALIASLNDTNLLHRGGFEGLAYAQRAAREFLESGGVGEKGWIHRAAAIHQAFIDRRLSAGGSADVLAMSLFVEPFEKGR